MSNVNSIDKQNLYAPPRTINNKRQPGFHPYTPNAKRRNYGGSDSTSNCIGYNNCYPPPAPESFNKNQNLNYQRPIENQSSHQRRERVVNKNFNRSTYSNSGMLSGPFYSRLSYNQSQQSCCNPGFSGWFHPPIPPRQFSHSPNFDNSARTVKFETIAPITPKNLAL